MAATGMIQFPSLTEKYLYGSFTLQHGVTPSIGTLYCAPIPGWIPKGGPLRFVYNSGSVVFPGCTIDSISAQVTDRGEEIWVVQLLDRRWKWRECGAISGEYNVRRGNTLVESTKKTARELAKLCLDELGEVNFDVSKMPDKTYPYVYWSYELPALALADLTDRVGCRIVLGLNNRVSIVPAGVGAKLPPGYIDATQTIDPAELPDELRFVGDRLRIQWDLELECIAPELDGTIKPIDELSYKPPVGWDHFVPALLTSRLIDPKVKDLVNKWMYKLFRVKIPFDNPITVPAATAGGTDKLEIKPERLEQILPLETEQIETEIVRKLPAGLGGDEKRRKPAQLWGRFCPDAMKRRNNYDVLGSRTPDLVKWPDQVYQRGWQLDAERGLVFTAKPCYLLKKGDPPFLEWEDTDAAGNTMSRKVENLIAQPPELWLRTTLGYRDKDTLAWFHLELPRKLPGPKRGTKPHFVVHPDVELTYYKDWAAGGALKTTRPEYEQQSEHYLDARLRYFQNEDPASATYPGFRTIQPDGAIQQVTFEVDRQGAMYTRASRNREERIVTVAYQERRLYERIEAAITKAKADRWEARRRKG